MKRLMFTAGMLASFATVYAQSGWPLSYWDTQVGNTLTVYADKAYIRTSPSLSGAIRDTLYAGNTVVSVAESESAPLTLKGLEAKWVQVTYTMNGKQQEGYIWEALLAPGRFTKDGLTFMYGVERQSKTHEEERITVRIKALDSALHVVHMKEWQVPGGENARSSAGKLMDGMGLDGVSAIVRIYFSGDACGIPTDYYYFGWNGQEWLPLPGKTCTVDAGAYYYTETILFPKEPGGKPGKILKVMVSEEIGEDGEKVEKTTTESETYSWDGKGAVKVK